VDSDHASLVEAAASRGRHAAQQQQGDDDPFVGGAWKDGQII